MIYFGLKKYFSRKVYYEFYFRMLSRQIRCGGRMLQASTRRSLQMTAPKNKEPFNINDMLKSYGLTGPKPMRGPSAQHPITTAIMAVAVLCLLHVGKGFFPPSNFINRNWDYSQRPFIYMLVLMSASLFPPLLI